MLYEPTTLANVARIIGETLQKDYGIDPAPIFEQVKIDTGKFEKPGSRVPLSKMTGCGTRPFTLPTISNSA